MFTTGVTHLGLLESLPAIQDLEFSAELKLCFRALITETAGAVIISEERVCLRSLTKMPGLGEEHGLLALSPRGNHFQRKTNSAACWKICRGLTESGLCTAPN